MTYTYHLMPYTTNHRLGWQHFHNHLPAHRNLRSNHNDHHFETLNERLRGVLSQCILLDDLSSSDHRPSWKRIPCYSSFMSVYVNVYVYVSSLLSLFFLEREKRKKQTTVFFFGKALLDCALNICVHH